MNTHTPLQEALKKSEPSKQNPKAQGRKPRSGHDVKSSLLEPVLVRPDEDSGPFPANLTQLLENMAGQFGDKAAMKIKRDGREESFSANDLGQQSKRLAEGLWGLGVRRGDRVVIIADNSPEWVMALFAIVRLGAIAVPMDPKLTERELTNLMQDCGPTVLFCSQSILEKIAKVSPDLNFSNKVFVLDDPASMESLKNSRKDPETPLPAIKIRADDLAVIIYTSGTTGNPKGVLLTHGNIVQTAMTLFGFVPCLESDRILVVLPLFHIYCLSTFLTTMMGGSTMIFQTTLKAPEILATLQDHRCTVIVGVPRFFELFYRGIQDKIAHASGAKRLAFRGLRKTSHALQSAFGRGVSKKLFGKIQKEFGGAMRTFVSGGGRLDPDIARFFSDLGFVVQEGYGLTETTGAATVNPFHKIKIGSVGKTPPGTEIRIDSPDSNGVGEILISGPVVFKGYYKNQVTTDEALRDGWFHTGDLGFLDREGYLTITGRKKDVIVLSSGKNVYPDEVESFYGQSLLIQQIGVIGRHQGRGEEVFACIVPKLDAFSSEERNDKAAIEVRIKEEIARISHTISAHKRIAGFRIFEGELPVTLIGKVKRHELHKLIEAAPQPAGNFTAPSKEMADALSHRVISIFKRFVPKEAGEKISLTSHIELDLGLDSLGRTELITAIEHAFHVSVRDEDVLRVQTVSDVVNILKAKGKAAEVAAIDEAALEHVLDEEHIEDSIPERLDFSHKGQESRLQWLENKTAVSLQHLPHSTLDPETLKGNIEHFIGMAQVPIGLAGPILVDGQNVQGSFYVPLATTEGALVASVTRGMMAITHSGGARARVLEDQIIRAPTWIFERGRQAELFMDWLKANFDKIKATAETTTRSGKLKELEYIPNGRRLTVRFLYTSGDASGQNMVTMATFAACAMINKEMPVKGLVKHYLENNLSGDKKMSMVNILSARGKKVYADAVIKKDVLRHFLHTTPEEMVAFSREGALGSMQAGIYGTNAQYANVLAAIFIATGQDVACTHEASTGLTVTDLTPEGDLYISVTLPNLIIATVGGGTGKGTQRECLEILGCAGSGKVNRLAEIIAASVLAGEISISGAHAAGDFAQAHDKLGRNRPDASKKTSDFTPCKR